MNSLLLLAVSFLLLGGCANLDVNVSVYNGPTPVSVQKVQSAISALENDPSGGLNKDYETKSSNFESKYVEKVLKVEKETNLKFDRAKCKRDNLRNAMNEQACLKEKKTKRDEEFKNREADLRTDLQSIQSCRQPLLVFYDKTNQALLTAVKQNQRMLIGEGAGHYGNLLIAWNCFYNEYAKLKLTVNTYLQIEAIPNLEIEKELADLEPNKPERGGIATSGLVGQNALIVGSPLFSEQISAMIKDGANWESINNSNFSAYWGDSQFVVVRKGLVEFRQKSLDFDPAPAVAAGSSITALGLKVASAVATGQFPAVGGESESSGTNTPAPLPKVDQASIDANQTLLNRRLFARQEYLMTLADIHDEIKTANTSGTPLTTERVKKKLTNATALFEGRLRLPKE